MEGNIIAILKIKARFFINPRDEKVTICSSEAKPDQSAAVRTTSTIAAQLGRGGGLIWPRRSKQIVTFSPLGLITFDSPLNFC